MFLTPSSCGTVVIRVHYVTAQTLTFHVFMTVMMIKCFLFVFAVFNNDKKKLEETEKENTNDEYDDRLSKRKTTKHRTDELQFGDRQCNKHNFSDQFNHNRWHFAFCILCIHVCLCNVNISNKFKCVIM